MKSLKFWQIKNGIGLKFDEILKIEHWDFIFLHHNTMGDKKNKATIK